MLCRKRNYEPHIVRLNLGLVCGFVPSDGTAFGTAVSDDEAFFGIRLGGDRLHQSAAVSGTVAGVYIKMYRP